MEYVRGSEAYTNSRLAGRTKKKERYVTTSSPMQLGMVGLGRMGANIVRRLMRDGHQLVGYDVSADAVEGARRRGRRRRDILAEFVGQAREAAGGVGDGPGRRDHRHDHRRHSPTCWSRATSIIDGGNTHYHDDIRHAAELREKGIHHVDSARAAACGVSSAATA